MRTRSALGSVRRLKFTKREAAPEIMSAAEFEKLHSKIGQLVVGRDFWPMPRFSCSGRAAQNGEPSELRPYFRTV